MDSSDIHKGIYKCLYRNIHLDTMDALLVGIGMELFQLKSKKINLLK